ncbi:MAG: glycosyltransferase [Thalassotalea sp.]|nr:glycosyltransferase [Thalassotalea sp.]
MDINILISTYANRISQLDTVLLPLQAGIKYCIAHQGYYSHEMPAFLNRKDISYFPIESLGVTKSRNFLIKKSSGDILYFCDDDITLPSNFYNILVNAHKQYMADVITFRIEDEYGKLRKNYSANTFERSKLSILSVGTIEISVKASESNLNIHFDEEIGAGTDLPCGDEAIYLSKFLHRNKKIIYVPETIAIHPIESSGIATNTMNSRARGVTLRRVFQIWGVFLLLPFYIKNKNLFRNDIQHIKEFIYGFFQNK